jgi:drug/metabolite transporter (DMT)-like permease
MVQNPFILYSMPVISAALTALAYVLFSRGLQVVPTGIYLVAHTVLWAFFATGYMLITKTPWEFGSLFTSTGALTIGGCISLIVGLVFIMLSVKYISPTFTAIVEILYVLLTPVFMYLLFRVVDFNKYTVIGGAVTLFGVGIVIYGQWLQGREKQIIEAVP